MAIYCLLMLNLCLFASWASETGRKTTLEARQTHKESRGKTEKMNRKDNVAQYCFWLDVGELCSVSFWSRSRAGSPVSTMKMYCLAPSLIDLHLRTL